MNFQSSHMNRSGVFLWQLVGSGFRRIYCRRNDNRNSININDALTWWQKIRRFLLRAKFRNTDNLDAIMKYKHVEQDMRLLAEAYPLICFVSGRGFHKQALRKKLSATKFQILQKWATYISKSLQQMERWEIVILGWEKFPAELSENCRKWGSCCKSTARRFEHFKTTNCPSSRSFRVIVVSQQLAWVTKCVSTCCVIVCVT